MNDTAVAARPPQASASPRRRASHQGRQAPGINAWDLIYSLHLCKIQTGHSGAGQFLSWGCCRPHRACLHTIDLRSCGPAGSITTVIF